MTPYWADETCALYLGDCREVTAWLDADVLITDPPYGMDFRSGMGGRMGDGQIAGDGDCRVRDDALAMWAVGPALVFGRWSVQRPAHTRMVLTWEKGNHVGMGDLSLPWKPNTEEIYVIGKGFTGHRGSSVIKATAVAGCVGRNNTGWRNHPTEKPVSLLQALIDKCPPGVIADPFAGSGSTLVAAKRLGRQSIGVEIDERYCEIAARRLSQGVLDFEGIE